MDKWIMENQTLFLGLVIAAVVIVIIIAIIFSIRKKAKKNNLLKENENLVELKFDEPVHMPNPLGGGPFLNSPGYKMYAVNGETPQIFGTSVLVPVGEVKLDIEYIYQMVGRNSTTSFGRQSYKLTTERGKKYKLSFNYIDKHLEHKEK